MPANVDSGYLMHCLVQKEVAIAVAGREALGAWGLGLATIAAAFSTGSAINATLFATARLMHEVAKDRELPPILCHRNENGVPDRPIMIIGATGSLLRDNTASRLRL